MFPLVLEKMTCDDVIEDGVAQKLQSLVTVSDVVVVVRGVGESLKNKERQIGITIYRRPSEYIY